MQLISRHLIFCKSFLFFYITKKFSLLWHSNHIAIAMLSDSTLAIKYIMKISFDKLLLL